MQAIRLSAFIPDRAELEPVAPARSVPSSDRVPAHEPSGVLVVVPTLNEAAHIQDVLKSLLENLPREGRARVVVVDGGSTDGTVELVFALAAEHPELAFLNNPDRIQSAAINLAARTFGRRFDVLVRCDAHAVYPPGFIERLVGTLRARDADAVVVPLDSTGRNPWQRAVAWVSNSPIGTGGASHRGGRRSGFVDHGHHAAFRLETFRRCGGYDSSFSHNEDAEYDCRQRALGARIYLDSAIRVRYVPRETAGALFRQYYRYGAGRSRTVRRHPGSLRLRQLAVPLAFAVLVGSLALLPFHALGLVWPLAYLTILAGTSAYFALFQRSASGLLAGPAAFVMHTAWALGFLGGLLGRREAAWSPASTRPLWPVPERDQDAERLRALLVDPSLFTGPYDGALSQGLRAAGVRATWAVRPVRPGDRAELADAAVEEIFYRRVDRLRGLPAKLRSALKGLAHVTGLAELVRRVHATRPDVVHFQWLVVPLLDAIAIRLIRKVCPVVVTVHDTVSFNGDRPSLVQSLSPDLPLRLADRLIVLTRGAKENLARRGFSESRVAVIPHGPMRVEAPPPSVVERLADPRWTFTVFGEIKRYKGIDVLVEAVGRLSAATRAALRVIVAGRPLIDLEPIQKRIAELELEDVVELRAHRLSEQEVSELFAVTNCFVFPYRQIDASGVYYQVKPEPKWIIASRVGIFAEELADGSRATLVPPEEPAALAAALEDVLNERARPLGRNNDASWASIGADTREVYLGARAEWQGKR
jgi:succinoglycan biosynthesis protein ExoA